MIVNNVYQRLLFSMSAGLGWALPSPKASFGTNQKLSTCPFSIDSSRHKTTFPQDGPGSAILWPTFGHQLTILKTLFQLA
jgi:hypothetical protein